MTSIVFAKVESSGIILLTPLLRLQTRTGLMSDSRDEYCFWRNLDIGRRYVIVHMCTVGPVTGSVDDKHHTDAKPMAVLHHLLLPHQWYQYILDNVVQKGLGRSTI